MTLIRYQKKDWPDPFHMITDLQDDMNRLFSTSIARRGFDGVPSQFFPDLDLLEEENQFVVKADLPGLKKEDIEISVTGNILSLKGERKEETEKKGKNFFHSERRFGAFQRTVEFPTEVDASQVKATYKDGSLELTVPKSANAKPKQIKIDVK